jgi:tripartite-type tricarboxylate transporter receptor subunit TctC
LERAFGGDTMRIRGGGAQAQNYPTKSVHIVVPLAAGGAADTITRAIAQRLTETWNQQVVVENKPGANTQIGAQQIARFPADGIKPTPSNGRRSSRTPM